MLKALVLAPCLLVAVCGPTGIRDSGSGLTGRVLHQSDVFPGLDRPYSRAVVVVFTDEAWSGLRPDDPVRLDEGRRVVGSLVLDGEDLATRTSAHAAVTDAGTYSLPVSPGPHVVCVGHLGENRPYPPLSLKACTTVTVGAGGPERVDLFFGEGGLRARRH
jgi:hypothetical protein